MNLGGNVTGRKTNNSQKGRCDVLIVCSNQFDQSISKISKSTLSHQKKHHSLDIEIFTVLEICYDEATYCGQIYLLLLHAILFSVHGSQALSMIPVTRSFLCKLIRFYGEMFNKIFIYLAI